MKRERIKKNTTKVSLASLEQKALNDLEKEFEESTNYETVKQSEIITRPEISDIKEYIYESPEDIKKKVSDLASTIMHVDKSNRSNPAVRLKAGELLLKVHGIGVDSANTQQLIIEILTIFNNYLINKKIKLDKDFVKTQKDFINLVFQSNSLAHLTHLTKQ